MQAYQRALNALAKFRDSFDLDHSFPIPLIHITQFIAYMSCLDMAPSTVKCYISAISFYNKINNYEDMSKLFVVRKMIDGMARSKLKRPDSRLPITIDLLKNIIKILPAFCSSRYEAVLFSSAFSMGFFAFLRVGEMTTACGREGSNHAIKIENVEVTNHNIKIYLASSKTDQLGRGTSIFVARQSDVGICLVKLLQEYLKIRPRIRGQLYCHFNGSPMTRYQFSGILKQALGYIGFDQSKYGTHSFRIGSATSATMLGFSDEKIKVMGRWSSDTFKSYIRIPQFLIKCR
ncbi:integrase/recombinase xerD homolog [Mytilus galloprovincialis]|uniref:integrase/recombinase xerD homolog n=1 Tax=Mytilus galloprovincialis TaxID=29158 RepID=UPI003F7B759C